MLRILLLTFTLTFTALTAFAQEDTGGEIKTGIDGPSDIEISGKIRDLFWATEPLRSVHVQTSAGIVTLLGDVKDSEQLDVALELAGRVEGVVSVNNEIQIVATVNERLNDIKSRITTRLDQLIVLLPLILVAIIAFVAITAVGLWVAKRDWPWSRIAPNAFIADLMRQIVRLAFIGLALVLALDILGATALLSTVLGAAGIVGLAVGFAVRDTVENYIASILLSVRQPFRPNDFVQIGDQKGVVVMLTSRATVLISMDGNHIRIPNATVFKGIITNFTRNADRRFKFTIGVEPSCNMAEVGEIGEKILADMDFTLETPGPNSWIEDIGDSSITITFVAWVNQRVTSFSKARSEAIRLVKLGLENEGVELPEPGFRINLQGIPGAPAIGLAATENTPAEAHRKIDPVELKAQDTHAEDEMGKKAEAEREAAGADNLLHDEADQELGS